MSTRRPRLASNRRVGAVPVVERPETAQPWHVLLFLLPMLIAYEIETTFRGGADVLQARALLRVLFEQFGWAGAHLPAVLVVVVLLVWQIMSRETWKVRPGLLLRMLGESVVCCVPLVLLALLFQGGAAAAATGAPAGGWSTLMFAVGAGIYEEFVFRLLLIALLHLVLVDVLGMPRKWGFVLAAGASAFVFALAHGGLGLDARSYFLMSAGVYLAVVFQWRGVGVAAGAHAFYDAISLSLLA